MTTLNTLSFIVAVTLVSTACSSQSAPENVSQVKALEMTPASAAFVRAYQNQRLTRADNDAIPLQVSLRVASASDATVCDTGELYGPYTVSNGAVAGDPSVSATAPTLRLANQGDLAICMIVTSPVDATIDINADTVSAATDECTEAPADISGLWEGPYSCTDSCYGTEESYAALTIVQSGYSATYTDSEASYEGTVCGNTFNFSGSGPGYTESGTFVLNADGTANKTSSYQNTDGLCGGSCSDQLQHY